MFFQGIVEDNNDPLKLGRVKARIIGKHSDNKSQANETDYYPTANLPWSIPVFPVNSSMISQVGDFKVPEHGSVVVIGFFDNEEQHPFYIGTIAKIPLERPDFTKGFSDPNQIYPIENSLNLSAIPSNAQGTDAYVNTPITNDLFSEPPTEYATVYPKNRVIQTSSGHIIEFDDTQGKERIRIYHKSGSFAEFFPDGRNVWKSIKSNYIITLQDNDIHIAANENKYIGGNESNKIDGNVTSTIGGALTINVTEDVTIACKKFTVNASGVVDINGSSIQLN